MKTNRTIFTLLLLGSFSMLFSCDTDYLYNTEIRIENASQHDIEIIVEKPSSEFLTGSVALKSGTTFTTKHSIDGGYGLPNPVDAQIKFDDGTTITHHSEDGDTYHNFCSATAFEKKCREKGVWNISSYLRTKTTNMPKSMQIKQKYNNKIRQYVDEHSDLSLPDKITDLII